MSRLETGSKTITVINAQGRAVLVEQTSANRIRFDETELARGLYLVSVATANHRETHKLFVK